MDSPAQAPTSDRPHLEEGDMIRLSNGTHPDRYALVVDAGFGSEMMIIRTLDGRVCSVDPEDVLTAWRNGQPFFEIHTLS